MQEIRIKVEDIECTPLHATAGAAGADLKAYIKEPVTLQPGERRLIPTGVRVELPVGFMLDIRPRSGLALKHGISIVNAPGTIDSDYRGDIGVILINHGQEPFTIEPLDRIAQMVLLRHEDYIFKTVDSLENTVRGEGGYGHTGVQGAGASAAPAKLAGGTVRVFAAA